MNEEDHAVWFRPFGGDWRVIAFATSEWFARQLSESHRLAGSHVVMPVGVSPYVVTSHKKE